MAVLPCCHLSERACKAGLRSHQRQRRAAPRGSLLNRGREGGKRIRRSVGKDAQDAAAERQRKEAELNAAANGVANGIAPVAPKDETAGRRIADAIVEYLSEIKLTKRSTTHSAYTLALRNFTDSCSKTYLEEIERKDLLAYVRHLREEEQLSDRTCHNRFEHLLTFMKAYGIEKLAKKRDWPKYVQSEPESYDDDELESFFAASDDEERVYFEFYLMTGFRKKEVVYCRWADVDLKAGMVRVTAKPEYGFRPKDWEEREVPIPDALVYSLPSTCRLEWTCERFRRGWVTRTWSPLLDT